MRLRVGCGILYLFLSAICATAEPRAIFFEGFNSDFSSPWTKDSWGRGVWGVTRSEIKSSGDGGTSATEGDGFCVMTVTAKPVGTPKLVCCHNVNLGTISEAGVTYLFTGDFSWRNTSQGGTQTDYSFKPNKTGFKVGLEGQVFGRSNSFIFSEKPDWEHRFHQLSFKYTTVERDIGKPIQLSLTLHGENSRAGSVELLTDNWQVIVADATASSLKSNQSDGPKPAADGLGLLLN